MAGSPLARRGQVSVMLGEGEVVSGAVTHAPAEAAQGRRTGGQIHPSLPRVA